MSERKRDAPPGVTGTSSAIGLTSLKGWETVLSDGWKPVSQCPEVQMCVGVYADLISSMTIHLMRNTDHGDVREINELSRRIDIYPSRDMTRATFMQNLVRVLMTEGNQVTLPQYNGELLENLKPLAPGEVSFTEDKKRDSYKVRWRDKEFDPQEVLHFVLNPDPNRPWRGRGYTVSLRDAVRGIRQAGATKQALMESPSPSIIVKVDGLTEEFQSAEGRKALGKQYIDSSETGQPWFIPAEAFAVEQVKPLTLNDLAIKSSLELDKRSVAAIFGVPPFLVGVGAFNQDEYQHFLRTRVLSVARVIEQEMTKKLLYSPDLYWRMNAWSLYNYSITDLTQVGFAMVDRAAMTRNELREWISLPPREGLDEMFLLENYLPTDQLGNQKKLKD